MGGLLSGSRRHGHYPASSLHRVLSRHSGPAAATPYGVSKVSGELLCDYYYHKFGVDTRGLRFPGLISHSASGRGTTDYAVEMYVDAIRAAPILPTLIKGPTLT